MKYYDELKSAILSEDFNDTFSVLNMIDTDDDAKSYFTDIFKLMEANPDIDYGMPGPVVHFMEKYYGNGYEEELLESVKRKPTLHTLWMMNRVLNDDDLKDRDKYLCVLEEAFFKECSNLQEKNEIIEMLERQSKDGFTFPSGEGPIGHNSYLVLWNKDELEELNEAYGADKYLQGIYLIGSDGGDEAYGMDDGGSFYEIPFIGMCNNDADKLADNFKDFIKVLWDR